MASLGQSAISGMKWNFASQAGRQISQLVTTIILARLLTPEDFGLVGMATVMVGFVNLFNNLGTSAAVIQDKNITEDFLSSVFWLNAAVGALATCLLAAISPLAALYYREPRVTMLLSVLAFSFVISGFGMVQQALLERGLAFDTLAKVEVGAVIFASLVGIGTALVGFGVWALVAQSLATAAAVTLLLWTLSGWRPKFVFKWMEIRRIAGYSLNLSGFNIFNYFCRNADYLLIGRFLGVYPLGIYTLAYRIMLYPLSAITVVVNRVTFPVYSQLQDDDARFRSAYLRTVGMIAMITFPMMTGLWVVADPFVVSIFGQKWVSAVPLIKILAPVGMIQAVGATVGTIYQAKGRTDVMLRWGIAASALTVAAFAIGMRWGVVGVALAYAIVSFVLIVPCFTIPFRLIGLRFTEFLSSVAGPFVGSIIMAVVVLVARFLLLKSSNGLALQILVVIGVIVYIAASWCVNRDQFRQTIDIVRKRS